MEMKKANTDRQKKRQRLNTENTEKRELTADS